MTIYDRKKGFAPFAAQTIWKVSGLSFCAIAFLMLSACAGVLREGPAECNIPGVDALKQPFADIAEQFGQPIRREGLEDGSQILLFQCTQTNVHNNGWASRWPWKHDAVWIDAQGIYQAGMSCAGDYADDNQERQSNIATDADACMADFKKTLEIHGEQEGE